MDPARLALRATAVLVAVVAITAGLLFAGMQVILAMDVEVPEGETLEGVGPSEVYDRDGELIARFSADVQHEPVELEEIAPSLREAVVAKEDRRFWEHDGVDVFSALRAVWRNVTTGTIAEGGSTLTQQYVKNVYVGGEQTYSRKAEEALIALRLERQRSKEEILADYLNQVYFGDGAYGAEAAAQSYFDKPAAELELHESAMLASVLSAPSRLSPRVDPNMAVVRRNRLLESMAEHDFVSAAAARRATNTDTELVPRPDPVLAAPFFVEEVRRQALEAYGADRLYRGNLRITTTLDLEQHELLDERVRDLLPEDRSIDAGVVALDHATGDVLATYSGRDFDESQVDLAMRFGRPSGSTFKPIVLATALEQGDELSTTYPAPGRTTIGSWTVSGGGCGGRCSLLQATGSSINTAFANIANTVGVDSFTTMAHRLGMRAEFADHDLTQALGTASISPLDLASAFGTFANEGVACPARTVLEVTGPDGEELEPPDPRQPSEEQLAAWEDLRREHGYRTHDRLGELDRCHRAIAPSVAFDVTEALQRVVDQGTGRNAQLDDHEQAGKTGTSDDSRELWFAGYTPDLSVGVFIGARDDNRTLAGLEGCSGPCFGGDTAALMWAHVTEALLADHPPAQFPSNRPSDRLPGVEPATPPSPSASPQPTPTPDAGATPTPTPGPTAPPPVPTPDDPPDPRREPTERPESGPGPDSGTGPEEEQPGVVQPGDDEQDDPEHDEQDDDGIPLLSERRANGTAMRRGTGR